MSGADTSGADTTGFMAATADERAAVAALLTRHGDDAAAMAALGSDGWLDILPEGQRWSLAAVACALCHTVGASGRMLPVVPVLAARAAQAAADTSPDAGGTVSAAGGIVTDVSDDGGHLSGMRWPGADGPLVIGPLPAADAGALAVVASEALVDTGGRLPLDRDGAWRRVRLPTTAIEPLTRDKAATARHLARLDLMLAATATGAARTAFERTRDHLANRRQFGVALSSLQVLQHRLVNMHIAITLLTSALDAAVRQLAAPASTEPRPACASARLLADRLAVEVVEDAIQLHGAIGFSAESGLDKLLLITLRGRTVQGGARAARGRALVEHLSRPRPVATDWTVR